METLEKTHPYLKLCPHDKSDSAWKLNWHLFCPSCNSDFSKRAEGAGGMWWVRCLSCNKEFRECEGVTAVHKINSQLS